MNYNFDQHSFQKIVDEVNRLQVPAHVIAGIFGLVGTTTGTLSVDQVWRAWELYKQSPAFKSVAGTSPGRAAS